MSPIGRNPVVIPVALILTLSACTTVRVRDDGVVDGSCIKEADPVVKPIGESYRFQPQSRPDIAGGTFYARIQKVKAQRQERILTFKKVHRTVEQRTCPSFAFWDEKCEFQTGSFIFSHVILLGFAGDLFNWLEKPKTIEMPPKTSDTGEVSEKVESKNLNEAVEPAVGVTATLTVWNQFSPDVKKSVTAVSEERGDTNWLIGDAVNAVVGDKGELNIELAASDSRQTYHFGLGSYRSLLKNEAYQKSPDRIVERACDSKKTISTVKAAMEREYQVGARSGYVDKVKLHELTSGLIQLEDNISRAKSEYRRKTGKALPLSKTACEEAAQRESAHAAALFGR